ncbi:hypothetical protein ABPG73_004610 [Tetrahymena malaccensis]
MNTIFNILQLFSLLIPFINCYCKEQKECYDIFDKKCKQIDGINFIGKDATQGLCVIESEIYDQIDFCFSLSYPVCLTQNMKSCINIFKSSHYVAIKEQNQLCLALNDYSEHTKGQTKSLTFIKEGYCLDNQNRVIQGKVINKQNQMYKCSKQSSSSLKQYPECLQKLTPSYCKFYFNIKYYKSLKIIYMQGITVDGICVFESIFYASRISCSASYCSYTNFLNFNTCLSYSAHQVVGQTLEGLCVLINNSYSNILFCSSQYCIQQQFNSTFSCVPFNGSPSAIGIDSQGNCLSSTQQAQSCFKSINICQDPKTKYCIDISQNYSLCAINGICYQMSITQTPSYIGRDSQYYCLQNSQTSPQSLLIDKCLYIPDQICQKSDLTQCIIYTNSPTYLGYIVNSGLCAQLNQKTSLNQFQNILNLSKDYCQDNNFVIQQINPQFQGRYTQYQMCLQALQPQLNLTVEFCIQGYCTQGLNSCQKIGFDGVYIAKLSNGKCGIAQQMTAIQCACFNCDVCLYNSQSCYLLQNLSITSGIDTNGNCIQAGTYISNLLKCQQNYCITKNKSGYSACVLIDGSPGQFGVDINGNCLDANTPGAIKCTDKPNVVCYDKLNQICYKIIDFIQNQNGCILNSTCQQLSQEQFIGRDKNFRCLLDQQNLDGTLVDICLNNNNQVCKSQDQMKCILYRNSNVYLGYIKQTGICAQLNQSTSTTAYSTILNLDQKYCQNNSFIIQNLQPPYVGRDSINQKCLEDSQTSTQVEFCVDGFCIANNSCREIGFDGRQIAKLENQQCSTDQQNYSIECAYKKYDVYFKKCESHHCKVIDGTNVKCLLIDGDKYAGIDSQGVCLLQNQATAIQCSILNSQICFDQNNKYCTLTTTFGTMGGCSLNGNCQILSTSLYVGRDINQQCLTNLQKANGGVDICINDSDFICMDQINKCCVNYPQSSYYLGYVIDNKQCAVNNQITYSKGVLADIKNLQLNYCQDDEGFIRQLDIYQNVGVDQYKFMCLFPYQQANQRIIQCYDGYCVTNNSCQLYNQTMIGRDSSYNCLQEGQKISVQCSISLSACLDLDETACYMINDINPKHSGVQSNGNCAVSRQFYQTISQCSFNHCKVKQDISNLNSPEGCFPFDESQQRIGIDQNGYCVQQDIQNAVRCMEGQFCLNSKLGNACQQLVFSYQLNRFARQKHTGICLPYFDITTKGNNIETCVQGSCLYVYTTKKNTQDYCFAEGTKFSGYFIIGTNIKGFCLILNQVSKTSYSQVIFISEGSYKCQKLSDPLSNYPNLVFRAKNANQTCQDINTENSIGCLDGYYCLDSIPRKCVELNPNDSLKIGRDIYSQQCIPERAGQASKCAVGYCIYQGVCIPFSIKYPGKELNTDLCLKEKAYGQYGASSCYNQGFCLMQNKVTGLRSCYKLDFNNPNAIGIEQDTQNCISYNQSKAVMCAIQRYCIDPNTSQCRYIDISQNQCVDQVGKCTTNGQCFSCNIDQCLDTNKTCQNLVSQSNIQCIDSQGKCQKLGQGNCFICPDQYCMINNYCLSSYQLLSYIKLNECFYIDSYKQCLLKNINQPDSNGDNFCSNNKGFCQSLSQSSDQCLQCPKYFTNPGNQYCFSINQKYALYPNQQTVYFQMKLTYVKQDCYDQNFCQLNPNLKCQTGCFSCTSNTFCTQCLEGYFLYQESTTIQTCIECPDLQYLDQDLQTYYLNTPTYRCLDCSSEYGFWNNTNSAFRTCTNYVILLDNTVQIVHNNFQASNFYVNLINGKFTLSAFNQTTCKQDCYSCMQITSSTAICLQCKPGFVLNNGVCISCPGNCVNCQYATLVSGYITLLTEQNLNQSSTQNGNFILVCLQCQVSFMVEYNLQSCIECGSKCNYCQYENSQLVWNYKQDYLKVVTLDEFNSMQFIKKCTQCQDDYYLSQNGEDCIYKIQNCDLNTVNINIGSNTVDLSLQIWSFISRTSSYTYNYLCKKCQQQFSLTDQGQCVQQGCQAIEQCYSCQLNQGKDSCLFCMEGNVLSNLQSPSICQYDSCQKNIYMCSECYLYSDSSQTIQFYQCTRCMDQNSIPSYNGCIKCPNGCSSCYEGTRDFNLTSQIIYDRDYLTLKQRLEYNQDNKYSLYCTNCLDGYYLDQQTKQCLQLQCGQNCLLCKLINNKPQCMQCNYNKLYSQISQLSFFIAKFYFNQNNIPNFNQMVSITASGNDCQVCPMMCETCINNSNLDTNPLYLYDSQCLSCKKPFSSNSDLQNYKIIFDKMRRKCYFCNNQEQGCYYKKQRVIYTQCLDAGSSLGVGTLENPINYNKLNQINIDQLILDEIDFNQAIVYYNELQVKQLEVQLIFIGDICVESKPQVFVTTLKDQVRSLETTVLNITTLNSNQNKSMIFQQLDAFRIYGFDQINIDGILFKQNQDFQNFGIIANDKNLTSFNLLNCSFFQLQQKNQVKQYLMMSLSTLQQAKLIQINNTLTNSSIYIEFNQVLFNQVTFSNSKLVHLSFQNITLRILNSIFNQTNIQNSALLLDLQQSPFDQQIRIKFDNLTYYQCFITNNTQILNSIFINQLDINDISFIQSQFYQGLQNANPLIVSNQFIIKGFKLLSSQINNYSFLQQYDSDSSLKIQMEYSYFENFLIQNNIFYQNNDFLLKFQSQAQINITINGMLIQENQFQESGRPIIIQLNNLNNIQINNITTIDNSYFTFLKADYSQYIFVSNIFQKQTNNQLLSPQLFQLNQIKNEINFLNITQQSIVISSNIIQIDNSFNKLYDGLLQISILNYQSTQTKLLYYNVTQNCALIAITSMQNSYLNIDKLNLTDFQTVSLIKNNQIGQIAYGIYIKAPTLIADVLNSNFTNLQSDSQFNWIQGSLKQINFDNCYFTNDNRIFNSISQVNGGFFNIISEQLTSKNSFFINGNAYNGGAFYWISQNRGKLLLLNSVFLNNTASNRNYFESQGGAVYIDGLSSFSYDIQIEQSIFQNNFALLSGGAIQIKTTISPRSAIIIEYSSFYDNLSNKGSNINIDSSKSAQTTIIFYNITCINNIKNIINLAEQVASLIVKQLQLGVNNQPSLIAIKNVYQVQIIQSRFQIFPNNFQPNTSPLTVNLILQKILLIINVQYFDDVSNFYEDSIFLGNLITVVQAQKIQIINTSITNNNSMQSNFPIIEQSQNIASYNSQVCNINLLKVGQNTCQSCNLGVINILASYLFIENSNFENNTAIYGSALFIQQAESNMINQIPIKLQNIYNLEIIGSQFKNNTALKRGGAIYINGSSLQINQTLFNSNKANLQGGAIYLENTDQNILKNTIQLFNCTLYQNYASMGGSIGSSTYQGINRFSQNEFILNKASKYGQNIQISPTRLVIYRNGIKQSYSKPLVVENHQGGYLQDSIEFRLSNDQNEELLELNADEKLQIKIENGFGFISINEFTQINGYLGALCEDCDRSGEYWGDKYFMGLNQKCQKQF